MKLRRFNTLNTELIRTVILVVAFGFILVLFIRQENQNKILLQQLNNNSRQRTAQINELQSHLDCVVVYLDHLNRQNLVISQVTSCKQVPEAGKP